MEIKDCAYPLQGVEITDDANVAFADVSYAVVGAAAAKVWSVATCSLKTADIRSAGKIINDNARMCVSGYR